MTRKTFAHFGLTSSALVSVLALLLAGCGSGGGGGSSSPPIPAGPTTATLSFTIPPAPAKSIGRRPDYISPFTTAIQIVINNVNGSPNVPPGFAQTTTINLSSASGGNCTAPSSTGSTCTVQVPAPAGNIVYAFTMLDAKGRPLATATKLLTILKGQSNNLSVILGGVVASVQLIVPTLTAGIKSSGTLTVNAFDASGGLIDATAPYAVPIVLTDTDQSLSTHLEVRNGIGPTAQINSASDVVTFTYDGNPDLQAFKLNASVGTAIVASVTVAPTTNVISFSNTTIDTGAPSDPNYQQPTIFFATVGTPSAPVTASTTATESGYSGLFTATLDPGTCNGASGPVTSISPSPATTFTVTSLNPGVCKVIVDDTIGHQSVFWVSVTTGVVGVNARTHRIVK